MKFVGGSTLNETTHVRSIHDIISISLRSILGFKMLLLGHSDEANTTSNCVPWDLWWWQNHIMTQNYCWTHGGWSHHHCHSCG